MTGRCFICGSSFDLSSADGTGKCPTCVGEAPKKADASPELVFDARSDTGRAFMNPLLAQQPPTVPNHGPCAHCGEDVIEPTPLWTFMTSYTKSMALHEGCRDSYAFRKAMGYPDRLLPPAPEQTLALQVEKLSPKAGDIIVIKCPNDLESIRDTMRGAAWLRDRMPSVVFMVLPDGNGESIDHRSRDEVARYLGFRGIEEANAALRLIRNQRPASGYGMTTYTMTQAEQKEYWDRFWGRWPNNQDMIQSTAFVADAVTMANLKRTLGFPSQPPK